VVKTRKKHLCHGCQRTFPKGSKLHSCTNADCSYIWTIYLCPACDEIIPILISLYGNDDEIDEGYVINYMNDENFKGTPEKYLESLKREIKHDAHELSQDGR